MNPKQTQREQKACKIADLSFPLMKISFKFKSDKHQYDAEDFYKTMLVEAANIAIKNFSRKIKMWERRNLRMMLCNIVTSLSRDFLMKYVTLHRDSRIYHWCCFEWNKLNKFCNFLLKSSQSINSWLLDLSLFVSVHIWWIFLESCEKHDTFEKARRIIINNCFWCAVNCKMHNRLVRSSIKQAKCDPRRSSEIKIN